MKPNRPVQIGCVPDKDNLVVYLQFITTQSILLLFFFTIKPMCLFLSGTISASAETGEIFEQDTRIFDSNGALTTGELKMAATGGGSGGSIWISANKFLGNGMVTVFFTSLHPFQTCKQDVPHFIYGK